jgi:hypothetical protein
MSKQGVMKELMVGVLAETPEVPEKRWLNKEEKRKEKRLGCSIVL